MPRRTFYTASCGRVTKIISTLRVVRRSAPALAERLIADLVGHLAPLTVILGRALVCSACMSMRALPTRPAGPGRSRAGGWRGRTCAVDGVASGVVRSPWDHGRSRLGGGD